MLNFGLAGRVVCVTGGASGIGRASALALARDGAKVAVFDLRAPEVQATVAELRALGAAATGCAFDVRDAASLREAAQQVEAELGPVWGLVASAGIGGAAPAEQMTEQQFADVMSVNVTGLFLCCQEFGRRMVERQSGAIVAIGSIDGLGGHPGRTHYVASKFAVHGIVRNLALEWGRHGVRVNCVAPNLVDTPLLQAALPPAFIRDVACDRTPMGRMARGEEVASAALMLLSDAASYVNGAVLPVDGGITSGVYTHRQGADLASKRLLEAGVYRLD